MRWRDAEGGAPSTPSAAASLREGCIVSRESERARERERRTDRKRRERGHCRGHLRWMFCEWSVDVWFARGWYRPGSRVWSRRLRPPLLFSTYTCTHAHTHTHILSTRTDRAAPLPPSVFNATDIKRLVCSYTAQSSCPFHMSHLLASSSPLPSRIHRSLEPYGDPFLPFSLLLDVSRTARSLVQPVNNRVPLL